MSFNYSDKPLVLKPGLLSDFLLQKYSRWLIEITKSMDNILILKSVTDGFNLKLCSLFTSSANGEHSSLNKGFDSE